MGVLSREKHPLQHIYSEKEGELIFKGGLIFERLQYIVRVYTHIYVHVVKYLCGTSNKCTHVGTPKLHCFSWHRT